MSGGFEDRLRRAERKVGADAAYEHNAKIAPCEGCGRHAGQIGILDCSSMRSLAGSTPGCERCANGLPGEIALGPVRMIRIVDSPSEEIRNSWR